MKEKIVKLAIFDLSGTLLQYGKPKAIPLMPDLLSALDSQGWKIAIVSRFPLSQCKALLVEANVDSPVTVLSSAGSTKGMVVARALQDTQYDEIVFVDDNPENLASVRQECQQAVRVIGFVGSRRYTPQLSRWCKHREFELALSPVDLIEGLRVHVDAGAAIFNSSDKWQESEVVALVPGLDDPLSFNGETAYFDHRAILAELMDNRRLQDYESLWRNIVWISCNQCLWKVLVRTVLRSMSIDADHVLGAAYKHFEYTDALKKFARSNAAMPLRSGFDHAIVAMKEGIEAIGIEAETCRMIGLPPMEPDRIDAAERRVREALP
jgi:predicted HAD superfamily phosphohydrolase YqeG